MLLNKTSLLNRISLPKQWQDYCIGLPESGMGYQKVACKIKKDDKEIIVPAIVLNCSVLESTETIRPENIVGISLAS